MSLKPFTYPLPETRFLHAGRLVYKLKIRYGNFNSAPDLNGTGNAVKELEEAIRVILGNLGDLHPFSTEHFTIFPYLSKWERVSKMRFKHENVCLEPYPYVCTMYLELNSFQQNVSCGKEATKGSDELVSCVVLFFELYLKQSGGAEYLCRQCYSPPICGCQAAQGGPGFSPGTIPVERNLPVDSIGNRKVKTKCGQCQVCNVLKVKRRNEVSEGTAVGEVVKRRRAEVGAETSCPQPGVDRTGAECVRHTSKAKHGLETVSYRMFRKRQQHLFSPRFFKWQA
ncbi:membrane-anchored junction protein [Balearica regulorum gibbericeps]|uniref:membrane-anchored junction protein n=1 Tax=Balearica regulorum gibbericeps TaxID=100784 RepID=UPI003F63A281